MKRMSDARIEDLALSTVAALAKLDGRFHDAHFAVRNPYLDVALLYLVVLADDKNKVAYLAFADCLLRNQKSVGLLLRQ